MPRLKKTERAFRKPYDPVVDRIPDRGKKRAFGAYHLHLPTIEWAAEQVRKLCEGTERLLREEGREDAANTTDFLARKIHGICLREHEAQRKALNRATKRDRERIEIEMKHTKRRAAELNALLDEIAAKEAELARLHGRRKPQGVLREEGLGLVPESMLEIASADEKGLDDG